MKKIAIIGSGIAGLHCALCLKNDAEVEIFEKSPMGGFSRPFQMEGSLNQFNFTPDLKPSFPLFRNTIFSPKYKIQLQGKLGGLYKIGGKEGIDREIRKNIQHEVKIHYSHEIKSLDELQDFDFIIAADGWRSRIALLSQMRERQPYKVGIGIGFTVKGDFNIGEITTILNNDYAPYGYVYLIPFDEKRATLAAAVGKYKNEKILLKEVREKLREYAKQNGLHIINEWTDYEMWYHFNTYQKNNIYVVGGAASFTDEALGYGLKYAIWSAKLCSRAILENKNYNHLLKPLLKELNFWKKVSPYFRYTKKQQDLIVKAQGMPPVKNLIEKGYSIKPFIYFLPKPST